WRREARQLLAERQDKTAQATLRKWVKTETDQLALEALWTLYVMGGTDEALLVQSLDDQDDNLVAWALRLLGEGGKVSNEAEWKLPHLASTQNSPVVLAQLACSAQKLPTTTATLVLIALTYNPASEHDPMMPRLIWWGLERHMTRDGKTNFT